jgi:hypothetical protein
MAHPSLLAMQPHTIKARDLRAGDRIAETMGDRWMEWQPEEIGTQNQPFPAVVCRDETRTSFFAPDDTVCIWPRAARLRGKAR